MKLFNELTQFADKNSHHIFTGLAIAGVVTTTILAIKATPKAEVILENAKKEKEKGEYGEKEIRKETVKQLSINYLPTFIALAGTVTSMLFLDRTSSNKLKAAGMAAALATTKAKDLEKSMEELLSSKKVAEIKDGVAKRQLERKEDNKDNVTIVTNGDGVMFLDEISGREFVSTPEKVRAAVNVINDRLNNEIWVDVNSLYWELGLKPIAIGQELVFHRDDGLINLYFSSTLTEDDKPEVVINYGILPRTKYKY